MYELNENLYYEESEEGMFFINEEDEKVFILGKSETEVMRMVMEQGVEKTASYVQENYANVGVGILKEIQQFTENLVQRKVLVAYTA